LDVSEPMLSGPNDSNVASNVATTNENDAFKVPYKDAKGKSLFETNWET